MVTLLSRLTSLLVAGNDVPHPTSETLLQRQTTATTATVTIRSAASIRPLV